MILDGILTRHKTEKKGSEEKLRADGVWSLETTFEKMRICLVKPHELGVYLFVNM